MNRPDYRRISEHLEHMSCSLEELARTIPLPDPRIDPRHAVNELVLRTCLMVAAGLIEQHADKAAQLVEQEVA